MSFLDQSVRCVHFVKIKLYTSSTFLYICYNSVFKKFINICVAPEPLSCMAYYESKMSLMQMNILFSWNVHTLPVEFYFLHLKYDLQKKS